MYVSTARESGCWGLAGHGETPCMSSEKRGGAHGGTGLLEALGSPALLPGPQKTRDSYFMDPGNI